MANVPPRWHSLLERLTVSSPGWGVWKNADELETAGDVDSIAPVEEWAVVADEFGSWAAAAGHTAVVTCRHAPGMLVLVAAGGDDPRRLVQLDVIDRKVFRGGTLFRASALSSLLRLDARGFRRLPVGAEGLIRSILDRTDRAALELVDRDLEGAAAAADCLGALGRLALGRGGSARLGLELRALGRALREPRVLAGSLAFDLTWRRRCPVFRALAQERRIPGDPAGWLSEVGRSHRVDELR